MQPWRAGDEAVLTRYGPFCGPDLAGAGAARLRGGDPRTARDRRGDRAVGRGRRRRRPLARTGPERPRGPTGRGAATGRARPSATPGTVPPVARATPGTVPTVARSAAHSRHDGARPAPS